MEGADNTAPFFVTFILIMPRWWNWQTRQIQDLVHSVREGSSPFRGTLVISSVTTDNAIYTSVVKQSVNQFNKHKNILTSACISLALLIASRGKQHTATLDFNESEPLWGEI